MTSVTITDIASALGCPTVRDSRMITTLLTDSRALTFPEGTLFFALVTQKQDGHKYIKPLYSRGVRAFVVSDRNFPTDEYRDATFITVPDTLAALQQVGSLHRHRLSMPVVGITGSNGKTTVKELLYQMIGGTKKVSRSPRSYNSAIGVPLSLWGISDDADLAIIEAGISRPGEMDRLERIILPTVGALTHLGTAHLENFPDRQSLIREKLRLFRHCDRVYGCLDPDPDLETVLREESYPFTLTGWSRSRQDAVLLIRKEVPTPGGVDVDACLSGREVHFDLPFLDDGTIEDCYLALSILTELAPERLKDLSFTHRLEPVSMRLETLEGEHGMTIINDTYNADIDSLSIALSALRRRQELLGKPSAVILSAFRESSHDKTGLYSTISSLLRHFDLSETILIGDEMGEYRTTFSPNARYYRSTEDFLADHPEEYLSDHVVLIKGAHESHLEEIVRRMVRRVHQTILSVNLSRLGHNLDLYRAHLPKGMKYTCMLKANAYGLGSNEVARYLEQTGGVDYFAVAVCDEGKELRRLGITTQIMVMNPEPGSYEQIMSNHLEPNIFNKHLLLDFISAAERYGAHLYPIHLKWNTGMHRTGFDEDEVEEVLTILSRTSAVRVASIFTHLSVADEPTEDDYTYKQLAMLDRVEERLRQALPHLFLKHALNTAGMTRFPGYRSDMVRLGCGLYGLSPLQVDPMGLEPVASLSSVILQTRELPAGATVGYGRKGLLTRDSRIGVIPIGYADGLPRQLGNGRALFRTESGALVPTVGNVCMDAVMLDLTDAPTAVEGSRVVIFDDRLPITRLSDACDTIHYEILSQLSSRIARHYFTE